MSLEGLIQQYGYLAILVGTFLEGETILVLGGLAASLGHLDLLWVIVTAIGGSFSGDQLFFYVGRHVGPKVIAKRLSWQESAQKVYRLLHRHQTFLIVSFRFYYGLRNVTPFAIGASQVARGRFFVLNAVGAVVWAIALGSAGYLSGQAFGLLFDDFRRYEFYVLSGVVALGFAVWLATLTRHRRRARRARDGLPAGRAS